jgi:hypothetical protein
VPDLRDLGERGFESVDGAGVPAVQGDADQGFEAEADGGWVQDGAVAGDDAAALQFAQPPVTGPGSELHPVGQFGHREAAILLKLSKDPAVCAVHMRRIFHEWR